MNCYFSHEHPGGTLYGQPRAVGVCQNCGVGVCEQHSRKARYSGAPLLCLECAMLAKDAGPAARQREIAAHVTVAVR